ncbi:MAG: ABC transporter substrate-binding protein [Fuerstiella sp.]|nr:ABC transporter substrate-binding protein [Fuerstiella sp.]
MKLNTCLLTAVCLLSVGCAKPDLVEKPDSEGKDRDSVRLALNWYPEAEHGGYFAADELGTFESRRLNVELIPGRPGASRVILQELAAGRIQFAVASADQVVEQRARGLPIVALLAPVQQSPRCIMVHESSGITSLQELSGVELAVSETRPFALWMKRQLRLKDVTIVPFNGLVGEFLSKPDFAQQAYVFSEPFIAREQGGDPVALMLSDIGYNPYASVLVTSQEVLDERPKMVRRMTEACRRGWTEYLKNPESTNRRIHSENSDMSLAALDYGVAALQKLCLPENNGEVGSMMKERWQQLIDQLVELNIIESGQVQPKDCYWEAVVKQPEG